MAETKRLLIAFAHPDDESFGLAGFVARLVDEGVEVSLICSTNGDVGSIEASFMEGYQSIAERRIAELECAAEVLKFSEVIRFNYRDSGMPGSEDNRHPQSLVAAPADEVTGKTVEVIRRVRPQVVVTFDPYGGYGHPDHIKMHETATRAYHEAGRGDRYAEQIAAGLTPYQPQRLFYQTFSAGWLKPVVMIMPLFGRDPRKFGRNNDIDLAEIVERQFPIHARVTAKRYKEIAQQARRCHASQLGGMGNEDRSLMARVIGWFRSLLESESYTFMQAEPPLPARVARKSRDVFQGVRIE